MNQVREIRPVHDFSAPFYHDNLQCLEREITELAAHIAAATYELLVLIGRYDAGVLSCNL